MTTFNVGDRVYFQDPDRGERKYAYVNSEPEPWPDGRERISVIYDGNSITSWPIKKYMHLVAPAGPDEIEEMFT